MTASTLVSFCRMTTVLAAVAAIKPVVVLDSGASKLTSSEQISWRFHECRLLFSG